MIHFSNIPPSAKWNRNRSAFRDFISPVSIRLRVDYLLIFFSFLMGFKSTNDWATGFEAASSSKENRLEERKKREVIQSTCSKCSYLEQSTSWRWWRDTTKLKKYVFFSPYRREAPVTRGRTRCRDFRDMRVDYFVWVERWCVYNNSYETNFQFGIHFN